MPSQQRLRQRADHSHAVPQTAIPNLVLQRPGEPPRTDQLASERDAAPLQKLAGTDEVGNALFLNQPGHAQDEWLGWRALPHRECLQIEAVINRVDLAVAIEAGANVLGTKLAVANDEARAAQPLAKHRRTERVILKNIFGVRGNAVRNTRDPVNDRRDLCRDVRVVRVEVPDAAQLVNEAAGLTKWKQSAQTPPLPHAAEGAPQFTPPTAAVLAAQVELRPRDLKRRLPNSLRQIGDGRSHRFDLRMVNSIDWASQRKDAQE